MQSSRVVFPSLHLRKLRRVLHSDNARSLRCAQNSVRAGNSARESLPYSMARCAL